MFKIKTNKQAHTAVYDARRLEKFYKQASTMSATRVMRLEDFATYVFMNPNPARELDIKHLKERLCYFCFWKDCC